MKLEGRCIRHEILKSTLDEIRRKVHKTRNLKTYCRWNWMKVHQSRNLKKYCRWNQREGQPRQAILKSTVDEIRGKVNQNKTS